MNAFICSECKETLDIIAYDLHEDEFELTVECPDGCSDEYALFFKTDNDKTMTCPKCGAEALWNMDEEIDIDYDAGDSFVAFGKCDACGCEFEETYKYDRTE